VKRPALLTQVLAVNALLIPAPVLADLGHAAALRTLVGEFGRRAGVETRFLAEPDAVGGLDADGQIVVYRVVQDCLSNVARHAGARRVGVSVVRENGDLVVRVDDDGEGFDLDATTCGLGLTAMRERAVLAGGRVCA
jgi:two-component system sensor histidine kinase UhpB